MSGNVGGAAHGEGHDAGDGAGNRGFSLLELVVVLAVAGAAIAGIAAASRTMMEAIQLTAAKRSAILALLSARRQAYLGHQTTEVSVRKGAGGLTVLVATHTGTPVATGAAAGAAAKESFDFAPGITVRGAPARGRVRFYPSGLADNATVTLGTDAATASVVVNQRGIIH